MGDVNGDGVLDVVVVDRDGILVIFGKQPIIQRNDTPQTARDLGTVVHVVEPTLTIVPGHTDAYYKLTVPSEAFPGAGDQVLDFSGGFANQEGAGLMMEVVDADGNLWRPATGFALRAAQDTQLLVHIFGAKSAEGVAGTVPTRSSSTRFRKWPASNAAASCPGRTINRAVRRQASCRYPESR